MAVKLVLPKDRSPRYPRFSVLSAVAYAKRLYDGAHRSLVDPHTAFRVMGFTGKTGASASALGALRQFGLVDGLRGQLKVSDLALKIMEPSSREEYVAAIHEAANRPEAFASLFAQFPDGMPQSDEAVRSYLIRSLNFSKAGADECISSLRKTIAELSHSEGDSDGMPGPVLNSESVGTTEAVPSTSIPLSTSATSNLSGAVLPGEIIRLPLTRECTAELRLSGHITQDALAKLVRHIELMQDVWAES